MERYGGKQTTKIRMRRKAEKAEAKARFKEAERLAQQPVWPRASYQKDLVAQNESGELLEKMNKAVAAWGHGSLRSADGRTLDIGGSTGGLSRRIIDDWVEPNWEEFLTQPDTNPSLLS